ncbi:hypothetical protein GCM10027399_02290 [Curvibacter fontanus]|jgi:hypothetical protein
MLNQLPSSFYSLRHPEGFFEGIQKAVGSIEQETGIYAGDNLFTYHRNLSFLEDEALMLAFNRHATTSIEQSLLWRVSTLLWGVRNGLRLLQGNHRTHPLRRGQFCATGRSPLLPV